MAKPDAFSAENVALWLWKAAALDWLEQAANNNGFAYLQGDKDGWDYEDDKGFVQGINLLEIVDRCKQREIDEQEEPDHE